MKALRPVIVGSLVLAAVVSALFTVGLRRKSPIVLDAIRRMNRAYVNPRQTDAGSPGAYASLIAHTGRISGTCYETPVVAASTEDGFVIALPYGTRADWVRNVLANGSATITHDGVAHRVKEPEVVSMQAADRYFAPGDRRAHKVFGTNEFLRVHRDDDAA